MATSTVVPKTHGPKATSALPTPSRAMWWVGGAMCAAVGALLVGSIFYATSVHLVAGNSDGATVVLEGNAMAHGNLALSGWRLSLDSFGSVDVPFYALAVLLVGLRPELLHLVPAVLALLVVAVALGVIAAGHRRVAAVAGAASAAVVLALPSPDLGYYLLQGPWHVGTALYCLAAFALVALRPVRWRLVLAAALLAAGILGDLLTVALGVAPLFLAGVAAAIRARRVRAGLSSSAVAVGAVALALAVRVLEDAVGTFTLVNRNLPLSGHQLAHNVGFVFTRVPALLGLGAIPSDPSSNGPALAQWLHLPALVLFVVALLVSLVRLLASLARPAVVAGLGRSVLMVEECLLFGVLADLVVFVFGAASNNPEYAKYLTPGIVFGVVLGGRLVARGFATAAGRRLVAASALLVACVLAVAGGFAYDAVADVDPPSPQPATALASFLQSHGLRLGVGDYWSSSLVTVESRGQVVVRPLAVGAQGKLRRDDRQSANSWYEGKHFQFFVCNLARPWHGVNVASAVATFGVPATTYAVGTYRVLVWARPVTVSLAVPSFHSPLQLYLR